MSGRSTGSSWREELEDVYRNSGVVEEYVPRQQLLLPHMDLMKVKRNGASRFPPKVKAGLPAALLRGGLPAFDMEEVVSSSQFGKKGKISPDLLKQMQSLEGLLATLYPQVCDNRDLCRKHGQFLYGCESPPREVDMVSIRQLFSKDLRGLLEDAKTLVRNVDLIRSKKLNEMLPEDIASSNPVLFKWHQFITERCELLRKEASRSEIVLHNLSDLADDLTTTHTGLSCKLDGIEPDWIHLGKLKQNVKTSNKAICYVAWMEARGLPICDAVFEFLQSPSQHNHNLAIVGYSFAPRELCELLEFFATNAGRTPMLMPVNADQHDHDLHSAASDNLYERLKTKLPLYVSCSIRQLVMDECGLNDYDMNTIASHLAAFVSLNTLCLRGNFITSVGVTAIATSLWDRASEIRTLRLDRNNVGPEGALALSKAIHRCRYLNSLSMSFNPIGDVGMFYILRSLMNPARKARSFLPRPFELSQKDGNYDYEDDIQSNYSDDEDRITRRRNQTSFLDDEAGGDEVLSQSQSEAESLRYTGPEDDKVGYSKSGKKAHRQKSRGADFEETESDVYTMAADHESVYTDTLSRRNSIQLHESVASVSFTWLSSKFDLISLSKMPMFLRKFRKIRFKMVAVSAFLRIRSRGHALSSLALAGCGLSSFSLNLIAHGLVDNLNVSVLDVSCNPLGLEHDVHGGTSGVDDEGVTVVDFDVTHVLDYAHNTLRLSKTRFRELIQIASSNGEEYEKLLMDIKNGSGIHVDKLDRVVFPAILSKDRKELFADILYYTGLSSLSLRSCGLLDHDIQTIVQLLNKVGPREQREGNESCSFGILKTPYYVENPKQLKAALRNHGASLDDDGNDTHHQRTLMSLDKMELDLIARLLNPEHQALFLQGFQRNCCLQSIDLSDNNLGPTSANWIASALGNFFLDDLTLSVGYKSPITLPRKDYVGVHGHSQRIITGGDDGGNDYDDYQDDLSSLGEPEANVFEEDADPWSQARQVVHTVKSRGAHFVKRLFEPSETKKREML